MSSRSGLLGLALMLAPLSCLADWELLPYAGYRSTNDLDFRFSSGNLQGGGDGDNAGLALDESLATGLLLSFDLPEAGKQGEIFYSRQDTRAETDRPGLLNGPDRFDLVVHHLGLGGVFYPAGGREGGFVAGHLGASHLNPEAKAFDPETRFFLDISGGYKFFLTNHLIFRTEIRGIFTSLDTGGRLFCAGGCVASLESDGVLQWELAAGLGFRF